MDIIIRNTNDAQSEFNFASGTDANALIKELKARKVKIAIDQTTPISYGINHFIIHIQDASGSDLVNYSIEFNTFNMFCILKQGLEQKDPGVLSYLAAGGLSKKVLLPKKFEHLKTPYYGIELALRAMAEDPGHQAGRQLLNAYITNNGKNGQYALNGNNAHDQGVLAKMENVDSFALLTPAALIHMHGYVGNPVDLNKAYALLEKIGHSAIKVLGSHPEAQKQVMAFVLENLGALLDQGKHDEAFAKKVLGKLREYADQFPEIIEFFREKAEEGKLHIPAKMYNVLALLELDSFLKSKASKGDYKSRVDNALNTLKWATKALQSDEGQTCGAGALNFYLSGSNNWPGEKWVDADAEATVGRLALKLNTTFVAHSFVYSLIKREGWKSVGQDLKASTDALANNPFMKSHPNDRHCEIFRQVIEENARITDVVNKKLRRVTKTSLQHPYYRQKEQEAPSSYSRLDKRLGRSLNAADRKHLSEPDYKEIMRILTLPDFQNTFSHQERVAIMHLVIRCTKHPESQNYVCTFVQWCILSKKILGDAVLKWISNPLSYTNATTFKDIVIVMQHLMDIRDDLEAAYEKLLLLYKQKINYHEFLQALLIIKSEIYLKKFPEKDLEKVISEYASTEYPLVENELSDLREKFKQVLFFREQYRHLPINQYKEEIDSIRKTKGTGEKALLRFLAIASECMRGQFGISPYNTQILDILALLNNHQVGTKGRISQMVTGDGKSTVVTLLASCLAFQGKCVDIVAPSRYLAKRDHSKYQDYFGLLGITSSHVCTDNPDHTNFNGMIVYGTHYDFEFSIMRDFIYQKGCRVDRGKIIRPFDVVIVDEVDNLFVDSATSAARISIPHFLEYNWVYQPLLDFVRNNYVVIAQALMQKPLDVQVVWDLLESQMGKVFAKRLKLFLPSQIDEWLRSAYIALFNKKEGTDYVVKSVTINAKGQTKQVKKIVIVDHKDTGRLKVNSRWEKGIHEFLEAKHGLSIERESLMPASISHSVFFNYYKSIYGVTGTMGQSIEREEVQSLYKVKTFDVPPHKPSQRTMFEPKFAENKKSFYDLLINAISEIKDGNRPLLILFETIEETFKFSDYLKTHAISHQLLNEVQEEHEDFIISKAGSPKMVTIATNAAGRGTDIIIHPDSLEAGGLHVILTFYPENDRVERQAIGRAARQGQPGSAQLILNIASFSQKSLGGQPLQSLLLESTNDEKMQLLQAYRNATIEELSKYRRIYADIAQINYQYLQAFFDGLQHAYSLLDDKGISDLANDLDSQGKTPPKNKDANSDQPQSWVPVLKQASEQMLYKIQQLWAYHFYGTLDNLFKDVQSNCESSDDLIATYKTRIEKYFNQVSDKWVLSLSDPKASLLQEVGVLPAMHDVE